MIRLDGVELNNNMVLLERYQSRKVAMSVRRLLGGKPYVSVGTVGSGFPITLQAGENYGWLTRTQVEAMISRADTPAANYLLEFGTNNWQVMFDNSEGPAVSMNPFVPRTEDAAEDYFIGSIKLLIL